MVARLPVRDIRMWGQLARRRAAHFGWIYGYESGRIEVGPAIPTFLEPLRARAAVLIGVEPGALGEVLVTDYPPGAGIGWHQDAPMFGEVVGVLLLGACRMAFAAERTTARRPAAVVALAPRSAYVLDGPARWAFRHRIPPGTSGAVLDHAPHPPIHGAGDSWWGAPAFLSEQSCCYLPLPRGDGYSDSGHPRRPSAKNDDA